MQTVNNDCISNGTEGVEEVLNPGGQVMVLLGYRHRGQEAVLYKLAGIEELIEALVESPASPVALKSSDSTYVAGSTRGAICVHRYKIWMTDALI